MRWLFRVAGAASAGLCLLLLVLAHGPAGLAMAQERGARASRRAASATGVVQPSARSTRSQPAARSSSRRRTTSAPPARSGRRTADAGAGSRSVGRHNNGRLDGGRELRESELIRHKHPNGDQHHGTDELVALLERGAAAVAQQFPGSRLTVGDLSRRRGGRMPPHRSHRSGRDVDVGFYILDASGEPFYGNRFLDFRADGTTRANPELRFDDARNWALVASFLSQDDVLVQYVFVARWLRQRLLDHAASIGAPPELVARAAEAMEQPRRGGRHDDHFHVRIYCPPDDRPRCQDDPPFRSWHPRAPRPVSAE